MSKTKTTEKKKLESYLSILKGQQNALKAQISDLNRQLTEKEKSIAATTASIKALAPSELEVTDHALLRYLERHEDIDLDEIREMIIGDLSESVGFFGNGTFPINGLQAVVRNNKVITIK